MTTSAGCWQSGEPYQLAAASGLVRLDGKPITGALVVFHSESNPIASGTTDDQGKFQLETRSHGTGAIPGEFIVQVHSTAETKDGSGKSISIPFVYSENGVGLFTVSSTQEENSFQIDLKSRPRVGDYLTNNTMAER